MADEASQKRVYRVPSEWIEQKRRMARWIAPALAVFGVALLAIVLMPRVDWSRAEDRRAAAIVTAVVALGMGLGALVGRLSFRMKSLRWESLVIELTDSELIRTLDGEEVRVQRANVTSIREFPNRGFVVEDNRGWRIFVPKIIGDYSGFRDRILAWTKPQ